MASSRPEFNAMGFRVVVLFTEEDDIGWMPRATRATRTTGSYRWTRRRSARRGPKSGAVVTLPRGATPHDERSPTVESEKNSRCMSEKIAVRPPATSRARCFWKQH
jgi:hypothetical protein